MFGPKGARGGERMSSYSEDLHSAALAYHRLPRPGKLEIQAIKPLANQRDLALAYSPGVAFPCETIAADPDKRRFVYVQHSPTFRFPDIITVEFVQLGPNRSSIAVYSRSRYGQYDFGKNRKRVGKWLTLLEKMAQPATGRRARTE